MGALHTMTAIKRTIQLNYLGSGTKEGAIDTGGARVSSVVAQRAYHLGSSAWSSGIVEMKGAPGPNAPMSSYSAAQNLTSGAPAIRDAGDADAGVLADGFIDFFVTTIEAGVTLEITVYLANAPVRT